MGTLSTLSSPGLLELIELTGGIVNHPDVITNLSIVILISYLLQGSTCDRYAYVSYIGTVETVRSEKINPYRTTTYRLYSIYLQIGFAIPSEPCRLQVVG